MNQKPLYQEMASLLVAMENCEKSGNSEWLVAHRGRLVDLVYRELPSGSGIDNGTEIDPDRSSPDRIVLIVNFHHMSDLGYYDGWTEHEIIVTPSLFQGFVLRITGRNRNEIKEYLYEVYDDALRRMTPEWFYKPEVE